MHLGSTFPNLVPLRYKDKTGEYIHYILCLEKVFLEPQNGWSNNKRFYYVINNFVRMFL